MRNLGKLERLAFVGLASGIIFFSGSNEGSDYKRKSVPKELPIKELVSEAKPEKKSASRNFLVEEKEPRPCTKYIVLHTTGANDESSFNSTTNDKSTNDLILTDGTIKVIVPDEFVAQHAGESIWNRDTQLEFYSVGIEVVGSPNQDLTPEQYPSLRCLVKHYQEKYNISDENVLTHAAVAYRLSKDSPYFGYRGRKVDGVNIDMEKIGVLERPKYDPDVLSGLIAPSDALEKILYPLQRLAREKEKQKGQIKIASVSKRRAKL